MTARNTSNSRSSYRRSLLYVIATSVCTIALATAVPAATPLAQRMSKGFAAAQTTLLSKVTMHHSPRLAPQSAMSDESDDYLELLTKVGLVDLPAHSLTAP
jgi:hypothetical protein